MGYTKRALKAEDDGTPVGQPHKMYLDCECGKHLPIPGAFESSLTIVCGCGIEYDSGGWIVARPQPVTINLGHYVWPKGNRQ